MDTWNSQILVFPTFTVRVTQDRYHPVTRQDLREVLPNRVAEAVRKTVLARLSVRGVRARGVIISHFSCFNYVTRISLAHYITRKISTLEYILDYEENSLLTRTTAQTQVLRYTWLRSWFLKPFELEERRNPLPGQVSRTWCVWAREFQHFHFFPLVITIFECYKNSSTQVWRWSCGLVGIRCTVLQHVNSTSSFRDG